MTRHLKGSLLIASMLVVLWATSAQACCHRRRACEAAPAPTQCCETGYGYAGSTGYATAQGGYATTDAGYYGGGYAGGTAAYPGGYGYGGYGRANNPGGLGGPMSGLGVRPGLGVGGLGRGR